MEEKILQALDKKFDKVWAKLSMEQRAECVAIMKATLENANEQMKINMPIIKNIQIRAYNLLNDTDKFSVEQVWALTEKLVISKKVAKEDALQQKIRESDDRQLLFTDIMKTRKYGDTLNQQVKDMIEKDDKILNLLSSELVKLHIMAKTYTTINGRFENCFSDQLKKVDELFPDEVKYLEQKDELVK